MNSPALREPSLVTLISAASEVAGFSADDVARRSGYDIQALRIRPDRGGLCAVSDLSAVAQAVGCKPSALLALVEST